MFQAYFQEPKVLYFFYWKSMYLWINQCINLDLLYHMDWKIIKHLNKSIKLYKENKI